MAIPSLRLYPRVNPFGIVSGAVIYYSDFEHVSFVHLKTFNLLYLCNGRRYHILHIDGTVSLTLYV